MVVYLDKEDLVSLVKGTNPHHSVFEHPLVKSNGKYRGGMCDMWEWNWAGLYLKDSETLWQLYNLCKESWK